MQVAEKDAVFGEVDRRLVHLGLPEDVRQTVMAMVRSGALPAAGDQSVPSETHLPVLVARTFYKTALRATETLGTSSLSMLVLLFDLFVAQEQGRHISVTSLCIASGAAPTRAAASIKTMAISGPAITLRR